MKSRDSEIPPTEAARLGNRTYQGYERAMDTHPKPTAIW